MPIKQGANRSSLLTSQHHGPNPEISESRSTIPGSSTTSPPVESDVTGKSATYLSGSSAAGSSCERGRRKLQGGAEEETDKGGSKQEPCGDVQRPGRRRQLRQEREQEPSQEEQGIAPPRSKPAAVACMRETCARIRAAGYHHQPQQQAGGWTGRSGVVGALDCRPATFGRRSRRDGVGGARRDGAGGGRRRRWRSPEEREGGGKGKAAAPRQ